MSRMAIYKYPSHSPNDGQASPCLTSIPLNIPILIACSILCLALPHHCPIHAPQSIDLWSLLLFLQAWVHAFPWAFQYSLDEINQNSFLYHSKLSPTIPHYPICMWNYSLKTPSFPLYLNSIPIYPILYTSLWKPINQSSGGVIDDMAIHSPHNSPFTDLNTI